MCGAVAMRLLGYFSFNPFDFHDFSAPEPRNRDNLGGFEPFYSLCFVVALLVAELVVWTDNIADWALRWGALYWDWTVWVDPAVQCTGSE
jgi:hypothetical protein